METFTQPKPSVRTFVAIVLGFFVLVIGVSIALFVTSEKSASGKLVTEDREVESFTSIEVNNAIDLVVVQGDKISVEVEAEEEIIGDIKTVVEGNKLIIERNDAQFSFLEIKPTKEMTVTVTVPELTQISLSGSGDVTSEEYISSKPIGLLISGSGEISIERAEVAELSVSILGSGNVMLAGKVDKQTLEIGGSGSIDAKSLAGKEVTVAITGSGDVSANASETLNVKIAGSGNVEYAGEPKALNQEVTGSGELKKL